MLSDPPYGTERCYNAPRKTPAGYYNIEHMLKRVMLGKGRVLLCGTCMDPRGLADEDMLDGAARSTMDDLSELTIGTDKVLVF